MIFSMDDSVACRTETDKSAGHGYKNSVLGAGLGVPLGCGGSMQISGHMAKIVEQIFQL